MAFPKPYRFYLKDGANYLYVNASGTVASQAGAIEIDYAPEDWRDVSISFERGWTYYGLFRLYTTPFKFVKDGATILRWGYYISQSVEKNITLVIEKFNNTIAVYDYEAFVSCEVDFSTMKDDFSKVEINLIEGGFLSKLKARENTTYTLDVVDNASVIWVKHDGIKLDCVLSWGVLTASFPQAFTAKILPTVFYNYTEGTNLYLTPMTVDPGAFQRYFIKNTSANNIILNLRNKVSFEVIMDPGNAVNGTVYVRYTIEKFAPQVFVSNNVIFSQGGLTPGSTTTIVLDQVDIFTINSLHAFEFNIIVDDGAGGGGVGNGYQINILNNSAITATFFNVKETTYFPALRPQRVYENLIEEISDGYTAPVSTLLNVTHQDKVITSGDAIRNLDNNKMKISFSDFWKAVNSVFSASFYYDKANDTSYLEDKITVFDNGTLIQNIGDVNNFKASHLNSEMFSKLKAGFGSYTYDEMNGKDEFNQLTEFLLPLTKTTAEKDLTSPIRADMHGIEFVRINLNGKTTTDADSDNDNFWLHIESASGGTVPTGLPGAGEPYYELYRQVIDLNPGAGYWEIENIVHPDTAFNIFFSAKRQLSRWAGYLAGVLNLLGALYINFQQTSKTTPGGLKLKTSEGVGPTVIDEAINEVVSGYTPAMFLPVVAEIDFPDSATLFAALETSPHGFIRFNYKGNVFEGFVLRINTKPKLETQNCSLLLTTNSNLSKIVYP